MNEAALAALLLAISFVFFFIPSSSLQLPTWSCTGWVVAGEGDWASTTLGVTCSTAHY